MSVFLKPLPLSVSVHGGQTRNVLSIEIGRKAINKMTAQDGDEVLTLVERWLNDGGVPTSQFKELTNDSMKLNSD